MQHFDDLSLMREIRGGNRAAFSVLVNRHSKYFFAIVYRFVGNRDTAEDILQTAFLKLWERPHKFDPDRGVEFKTWFARVVVNLCRDDKRTRRPVANIDDYEIADDRAHVSDIIDTARKQMVLQNAIAKLSVPYRTAINLGVLGEMQYADVAKIMGKSTGAVKVMVNRAKEQIKCMVKEQGYELD